MSQIVFGILLLIAFSVFAWTLNRFICFIRLGKAFDGELNEKTARLGDLLVYFLFQKKVAQEKSSWHHLLIFWGFLIICVGTLELIIKGLVPSFSYEMIIGHFLGLVFHAVLDVTNALVLLVMCYSFFRRLVLKPKLIPMSGDAALILSMISLLCITHFLMHAYHFVDVGQPETHMVFSTAVTAIIGSPDAATAATLSSVNFWIHMIIVLFFLNYIPYSKHIHLLGALPNIYLRNRGQAGILPKRDLEDEKQWGVGFTERFTWKDLLDTCACTECARCSNNCPAFNTDKPLSPMQLIHDIRDEMRFRGEKLKQLTPGVDPTPAEEYDEDELKELLPRKQAIQAILEDLPQGDPREVITAINAKFEEQEDLETTERLDMALSELDELNNGQLKHRLWGILQEMAREAAIPVKPTEADLKIIEAMEEDEPMVGGRITEEVLWSCVTCGACEAVCPVFIEHPKKIIEMRAHLVQAMESPPTEAARMFRGVENNSNPWGLGSDQRMDWAEGLDVPVMEEKGEAEYLVWIGCAGSFDDRAKKISRTWVELLQHVGVDFAVLGLEEGCTGDAARRAGNEFLFQTMAEMNIELFTAYKVKKILVTCPHCYHSFKNEYPAFGGEYEVIHHTQFLKQLISDGKLGIKKPHTGGLTFHDSCYLGRWNEVYTEPRDVLASACGGKAPVEMERTGYKSFCCGAGGGRMWMEEEAPRINEDRTREALQTGADTIATACPFCITMITDGVKAEDKEEDVQVLDVVEVVWQSIQAAKDSQ